MGGDDNCGLTGSAQPLPDDQMWSGEFVSFDNTVGYAGDALIGPDDRRPPAHVHRNTNLPRRIG